MPLSQFILDPASMKTSLFGILVLATLAQARPRYMLVPIDDVVYYPVQHRMARAAWPGPDGPGGLPAGPAFAIPDNIRAAEEQIASGR